MCEWGTLERVKLCKAQRGTPYINVDACIAPLIQALNDSGIETVASCCGHGKRPGSIIFKDGEKEKELIITDFNTARWLDRFFPDIHGEWR